MPNKKKTPKPDGYTGAARTQVGRVNKKLNKKANGDKSSFKHSVESDYLKKLNSLQKRLRDDIKGTNTAKEFESDVKFERTRKATSEAAKKRQAKKTPAKKKLTKKK